MRTRRQALLCNDVQVEQQQAKESAGGVIKKYKLKVDNGRSSQAERPKEGGKKERLKIVLKRKPDEEVETPTPVIKKHKRGLRQEHARKTRQSESKLSSSKPQKAQAKVRSSRRSSDVPLSDSGPEEKAKNGVSEEQEESKVDEPIVTEGQASGGQFCCTVNTEMVTDVYGANQSVNPPEASLSSEPSCSTDSSVPCKTELPSNGLVDDDLEGTEQASVPKATRTPLFFPAASVAAEVTVPAKRSPLPLPPAAVRSALPQSVPPAIRSDLPQSAPPAVRSALPAPPAVRSALPLPPVGFLNEEFVAEDGKVLTEEVDTHGFSSAITGADLVMQGDPVEQSSEDGEEEMLSPGFLLANTWHDDASISQPEFRKKGGPGSRATYRCSRCLAPKKGHRCPFESEALTDSKEDTKAESIPKLVHKRAAEAISTELVSSKLQKNHQEMEQATKRKKSGEDELLIEQEDNCPSVGIQSSSEYGSAGKTEEDKDGSLLKHEESSQKTGEKIPKLKDTVLKEFSVSSKWLLETGVLEGHSVRYMPRPGEVLGTGVVRNGVILCSCKQCKGQQSFNASSFEKHVGSTARHPSDFIFLENGRCLREILEDASRFRDKPDLMKALRTAVSMDWETSESCGKCGKGGDLAVRCSRKGCLNSYHKECLSAAAARLIGWLCPECLRVDEGSTRSQVRNRQKSP